MSFSISISFISSIASSIESLLSRFPSDLTTALLPGSEDLPGVDGDDVSVDLRVLLFGGCSPVVLALLEDAPGFFLICLPASRSSRSLAMDFALKKKKKFNRKSLIIVVK